MVVVSGSWVKNVATYPSPAMASTPDLADLLIPMNNNNNGGPGLNNINNNVTNNVNTIMVSSNGANNGGVAKAVLMCRPNSHPFQERTLMLDQPVKVREKIFVYLDNIINKYVAIDTNLFFVFYIIY